MTDKSSFLDRITNRLAAVNAAILGVTAFLNGFSDFFSKLVKNSDIFQQLPEGSRWGISALLILIALYLLKVAFARKSRLRRPERFLIPADDPRFLKGREREILELGQLCERHPLVFLDGESGCGKSALVRAGVLPWCEGDAARPLPILIDLSGAPWDEGLTDLLGRALWTEHKSVCEKLGFTQYPQPSQVFEALAKLKPATARLPLLVFDQFDDYQTAYRDKFYPAGGSSLSSSQEFLAGNPFWSRVAEGARGRQWHCLAITRNDTRAGLDVIRFCEASSYTLWRVEHNLIAPLLDQITTPGPDNAPVVEQPEYGWNQLRDLLLKDLAGQQGQILPIQMVISLDAISRWTFLTAGQYRAQGGLPGLERLYVQGYTKGISGLSETSLIALLLRLIDPVSKKARRASFEELSAHEPGVSPETLQEALHQLQHRRILRQMVQTEKGGEAWLLYHDYLVRGVMEVQRANNRWRLWLEEQAAAWQEAAGWREKWRTLLPVRLQPRLVWEILRRRLSIGQHRRYLAWSSLRLLPGLLTLGLVLAAYDWAAFQQELNIAQSAIAALDNDSELSNNEANHLREFATVRWRAKQQALQAVLENEEASARASHHPDLLIHLAVGLDLTGERSAALSGMCQKLLASPNSTSGSRAFVAPTLAQIRLDDIKPVAQPLMERMKTEQDSRARSALAEAVAALAAKLEPAADLSLAQPLMERMKTEQDGWALSAMAQAVVALAAKLEPAAALSLAQPLMEQMKTEQDSRARSALAEAVAALAAKLEPAAALSLAQPLVERMKTEQDSRVRSAMAQAVAALEPAAALSLAQPLVERMKTERDSRARSALAQAVANLAAKLEPAAALSLAQPLVEQMKTEQDERQLSLLAKAAQSLETRADMSTNPDSASRLQSYVDLLKGFAGGFEESRKVLLDIIGAKTGQKFEGDKWRFVAWATSPEAEKFHLKLD